MKRKKQRIWVVVADGAHARFLTPDDELRRLQPAGPIEFSAPDGNKYSRDLKSDRPGRSFSSARGGVRHAIEPKHDYHKMEKHKFTAELAKVLDGAVGKKSYDSLVLVAPRRSLGELRELLSDRVQACIRHEMAKDLTKSSRTELWKKLAPAVKDIALHE